MSHTLFNPFPGLRPFDVNEEHLFFGREQQTADLLRLLRTNRLVTVVGASGSGKSSAVRAGLLPELLGGTMNQAGSAWEVAILRPGTSPVANLAAALCETDLCDAGDPETLPQLMASLTRSSLGLIEAVHQSRLEAGVNLLVVVDQFEELFRFHPADAGTGDTPAAFVNLLLEASRQQQIPIYVVLTMRSDFLGDCARFQGLPEAINAGEYLISRLTREQLRCAIENPVKVGGTTISFRLVQELLNGVGRDQDQLPVLQHALMRTWDNWETDHVDGEPLDVRHYAASGGMHEALSRHADEVFEELGSDRLRLVTEKIFKALTEGGADHRGIRRPATLDDLGAIAGATREEVMAVVEAFRQPGRTFLTPREHVALTPHTVIDISHESLMRVWHRLSVWVEEEARSARVYRRLADTAALYAEGKAGLYRDPDLQVALQWREKTQPTSAWAERYHPGFSRAIVFLESSRRHAGHLKSIRSVLLAATASVALLMGVLALTASRAKRQAELARHKMVEAEVTSLLNATPEAVHHILAELQRNEEEAIPLLREQLQRSELYLQERIRLQLALLRGEDRWPQPLQEYWLWSQPREFRLVRDTLARRVDQPITDQLWSIAGDDRQDSALRFRAACALAGHDPEDGRWDSIAGLVTQHLVTMNVLEFKGWSDALRPVKSKLVPHLEQIYRNAEDTRREARSMAAAALADFASDQPEKLVDLVEVAEDYQFPVIFAALTGSPFSRSVTRIHSTMNETAAPDATDAAKELLARRQANGAVFLMKEGYYYYEDVWPRLRHSPDPRLRSLLIHRLPALDVSPNLLARALPHEEDASIRAALLLSLGEYATGLTPASHQQELITQEELLTLAAKWYRDDPDSGVHGAALWLLRRRNHEARIAEIDKELRANEQQYRDRLAAAKQRWYVNTQGHTMVIVPGPSEFQMGSPAAEVGRSPTEQLHSTRIEYSFAIASQEVTLEQFLRFHPGHQYSDEFQGKVTSPVNEISWYRAAEYCNWLSQQEGIPEEQWCYPTQLPFADGMQLAPDYLTRTGYRLPTEAEWEYACRAGTTTSRCFGESDALLGSYAWYAKNAVFLEPVARLKPNDWGLFDMHGNAYEWCADRFDDIPNDSLANQAGAQSQATTVNGGDGRVLRGGSFINPARRVRSAFRLKHNPGYSSDNTGFRVARTYPSAGSE